MGALTVLSTDTSHPLERVSIFTPLGLRFWDEAYLKPVENGVSVQAFALDQYYPPVQATRSASGIYVLQNLPGLGLIEHPPITSGRPAPAPGSVRFAITVEDTLGRYTPILFGVALPLTYRGLFIEDDPALAGTDARLYLYSMPTRAVATGMAEIRAELWDVNGGQPAAYAVLTATLLGISKHAIADEQGRCLIEIPWPIVERLQIGSPPGQAPGAPLTQQWPITIEAQYGPQGFNDLLQNDPEAGKGWQTRPSLKSILEQPVAPIWPTSGSSVFDFDTSLTYGSELILRTAGSATGQLLISTGSSPP